MNKIKLLVIMVSVLLSYHAFSQLPAISYGNNTFSFTTGLPVGPVFPTNNGGPVYAYGQTLTFVGSTTGTAGSSNGTGNNATFFRPFSLLPDQSGNFYLSDGGNNRIRFISATGVVTTFAVNIGTSIELNYPTGLSKDASGNLYVSEAYGNSISMITSSGVVSRLAGNGTAGYVDGPATNAEFNFPLGTAVDASGNIYVSDWGNHVIRKITTSGTVSTFAGNGTAGYVNGTGTAAKFDHPSGLIFDAIGNLYVADEYNQVIRKITPTGVVSTLSGSGNEGYLNGTSANADFFFPSDVALDRAGNFYVAEYGNRDIRKIGTDGTVSLLAGTPGTAGLTDGVGAAASFNLVDGVTVGIDGNVYVPDYGNDNIREIVLGGYSISPALPMGLTFDRVSGSISGTPAVVSGYTNYSVMARNASGAPIIPLNLAVNRPAGFNPSQNKNYIITYTPRFSGITNNGLLSTASTDMNQVEIGIQYVDGLGRPMQTIQVKGSPMGNDIVQPIAYDAYGRETTKYLPYTLTGNTVSDGSYKTTAFTDQSSFYTAPPTGISPITTPQALTALEPSPLNRVLEQGAPGDAWQLTGAAVTAPNTTSGHTVKTIYTSNDSVNYWAKLYTVNIDVNGNRSLLYQGAYPKNQLYVTVSQGENWSSTQNAPNTTNDPRLNTTEEYKDKDGHIVLKRTYNYAGGIQILSTYYVYDDFDNLAFVLPPGANPDVGLTSAGNQAILNSLCYQYSHDGRNRMVTKQLPGKGVEEMVYDQIDQLVFERDANQKGRGEWGFVKYDGMGRMIITGVTKDTSSRAPLQSFVTNMITLTDTVSQWEIPTNVNGIQGYTDTAFPFGNNQVLLTVNYYDNYSFPGNPYVPSASGLAPSTIGLLTGAKTAVLNTDGTYGTMLYTTNYYDGFGRTIETLKEHYLGGTTGAAKPSNYDDIVNSYDFSNEVTGTIRHHYTAASTTAAALTIGTSYFYDHIGRKTQTWEAITVGTSAPSSAILLSQKDYNEIGQVMTKHLHSTNGGQSFLQNTNYTYNERGWLQKINDPTVAPTPTQLFAEQVNYNQTQYGTPAQFNGNIAENIYNAKNGGQQYNTYNYDPLSRLTSGINSAGLSETGMTYDLMGNLLTLTRAGAGNGTLNYTTYNGDQLMAISGFKAGSYIYDNNGNMTTDGPKEATIAYNMLNLPRSVTASGISIAYLYSADGNKLRKISGSTTTDYIGGIQYKTGATTIDFVQTEEGRAINSGSSTYNYEYTLIDHLGNNRVAFDMINGQVGEDDYYPFGLYMPRQVNAGNNYLYNKKELQPELTEYDYGARFYDPVIARWGHIDKKAELYFQMSSYAYAANNPVSAIDPDGRLVIFVAGQNKGTGNSPRYWDGFDKAVQNHFHDFNNNYTDHYLSDNSSYIEGAVNGSLYIDGALGGWKNTLNHWGSTPDNLNVDDRLAAGYEHAGIDISDLINSLQRTDGVITESIKVVAHSMGAAYARGLIAAIIEYVKKHPEECRGLSITEYDFAAFQQNQLPAPDPGVTLYQFDNLLDPVVGGLVGRMNNSHHAHEKGRDEKGSNDNVNPQGKHSIVDFMSEASQLAPGKYKYVDGKFVKID